MTANAMKNDREMCIKAGMTDYISKPVTLDAVRSVLAKWVPTETPRSLEGSETVLGSEARNIQCKEKPYGLTQKEEVVKNAKNN
jgi:DNA-binding NarL/FixJ family response regulator